MPMTRVAVAVARVAPLMTRVGVAAARLAPAHMSPTRDRMPMTRVAAAAARVAPARDAGSGGGRVVGLIAPVR